MKDGKEDEGILVTTAMIIGECEMEWRIEGVKMPFCDVHFIIDCLRKSELGPD